MNFDIFTKFDNNIIKKGPEVARFPKCDDGRFKLLNNNSKKSFTFGLPASDWPMKNR